MWRQTNINEHKQEHTSHVVRFQCVVSRAKEDTKRGDSSRRRRNEERQSFQLTEMPVHGATRAVRLGMLTPSSNSVLEPATAEMLVGVPGVTAHFGRFRVLKIDLAASASQFTASSMVDAAALIADANVNTICWNGTSGGWEGFDADERLCAAITERTGGVPASTSTLALNEALRILRAVKIAFVTPYLSEIQEKIIANYENAGFKVVAERHLNDAGNDSFADYSESQIAAMCRSVIDEGQPDAVIVFCTNFRGYRVAPVIESEAPGVCVLDTVSLALWKSLLQATGRCPDALSKWGKLFTLGTEANPPAHGA